MSLFTHALWSLVPGLIIVISVVLGMLECLGADHTSALPWRR
jgi:hypothetical protein